MVFEDLNEKREYTCWNFSKSRINLDDLGISVNLNKSSISFDNFSKSWMMFWIFLDDQNFGILVHLVRSILGISENLEYFWHILESKFLEALTS